MELIDYVTNTPQNTNKAILKQLLNNEKNNAVYESVEELKRDGSVGYEENILSEIVNDILNYDSYEGQYMYSFPEENRPIVGESYFISINGGVERQYVLSEEMTDTYIDDRTGKVYNLLFGVDWVGGIVITANDGSTEPINVVIKHIKSIYHKIDEKFLPKLVGKIENEDITGEIFNSYEGSNKNSAGTRAHAEGSRTTASGECSHAEGMFTTAEGFCSHAEGGTTFAQGPRSHAEGDGTIAQGDSSHAEGRGTIAHRSWSHVEGSFNIIDSKKKYIHIVGNGTRDESRSNAHTLDKDGNAWFAGGIELTSPNGTRFRFTVNDAGQLSSTQLPEDEE